METVLVDFNDIAEDGLLEAAHTPLTPGTVVFLRDFEGNSCFGTVSSYDEGLLRIQGQWRFWSPAELDVAPSSVNQAASARSSSGHDIGTKAATARIRTLV